MHLKEASLIKKIKIGAHNVSMLYGRADQRLHISEVNKGQNNIKILQVF